MSNNPNPTIDVKINETDREIFMSFGLLNELTSVIDDPSQVATIAVVPTLREDVLKRVLSERTKTGKVINSVDNIYDIDISIEDAENVIEWVMEHLMAFFMRSLRKVAKIAKDREAEMEALASSLPGSKS